VEKKKRRTKKKYQSFTGSGEKHGIQPEGRVQPRQLKIGLGEETGAGVDVPALLEVTHRLEERRLPVSVGKGV